MIVEIPIGVVPARHCPRKLKRGQCKRFTATGALFAYTIACPVCGFIELHTHEDVGYVELGGVLISAEKPMDCMYCRSTIHIKDGVFCAVTLTG